MSPRKRARRPDFLHLPVRPNEKWLTMLIWDIETGGLPDDELRSLYTEPTWEEFSASCDQRWKEETKREKFEAAKVGGWEKFRGGAALSPHTGRVLAIGFQSSDKFAIEDGGGDEEKLLARFWHKYTNCRAHGGTPRKMAGWNIHGFDLPFLIKRSWFHQVEFPQSAFDGRNFDPLFVDLMQQFTPGGWREFVKLDTAAKFFRCGGKLVNANGQPIGGGEFAKLWLGTAEEREQAIAYLRNDLEMTAGVAGRMGLAL